MRRFLLALMLGSLGCPMAALEPAPAPYWAHAAVPVANVETGTCIEEPGASCPVPCDMVDCDAQTGGCFAEAAIDVRPVVNGRIDPATSPTIAVTASDGGLDCACSFGDAGWQCGPRCRTRAPTCARVELEATPGPRQTLTGWSRACEGPRCSLLADAPRVTVAVAALSENPGGIAWVEARADDAVTLVAGGSGPWLATATETSMLNTTVPKAGAIVFRRATTIRVFDEQGRTRWERRLGGVGGDVQPQAVLATPIGGALLAARFPDDPVLPIEHDRKAGPPVRKVDEPRLRIAAFSSEGDPLWTVVPTIDGHAHLLGHPRLGAVVAVEGRDPLGLRTDALEIMTLSDDGAVRWRWVSSGDDPRNPRRIIGLAPAGDVALVVATLRSGAEGWQASLVRVEEGGRPGETVPVDHVVNDAGCSFAGLGPDAFVLASNEGVSLLDGSGTTRAWLSPETGVAPDEPPWVARLADGAAVLTARDGGFEVRRIDANGDLRWIEHHTEVGNQNRGVLPLGLAVQGDRPVVVGRAAAGTRLGSRVVEPGGVVTIAFDP